MNLQQELKPFRRNATQTGLGASLIILGLLIASGVIGQLMVSQRFDGAALVFIIATAIVTAGILILDAIRCKG